MESTFIFEKITLNSAYWIFDDCSLKINYRPYCDLALEQYFLFLFKHI